MWSAFLINLYEITDKIAFNDLPSKVSVFLTPRPRLADYPIVCTKDWDLYLNIYNTNAI